ncbi:MAG TPA: serine hydrolase [Chitinophagaceae bacterium]|jgi:beta-lactamase class A|nr:serine hydrolase [Chitinophagaceae bacterium]
MKYLSCFILILFSSQCYTQKTDKKLEVKINDLIKDYHGDIGIYIKCLKNGKTVLIHADTIFPTASIVKVPILIGVMDKINRKELFYDSAFTYKDSLLYEGEDILGSFKNDEKILLKKIIMLMLTTSDNTASLWLQSLAGKGTRINEILDSLGLRYTRINSRTPGRENSRSIYGWGQTTPSEMGTIFEMIYRNQIFSPAMCERMMRCLSRNYWDENEAISQVPPNIEVFSKNGCVNASRSEVLLVNAPHNPYIFCIFTKDNKDISWVHDNEAWVVARKISKLLWNYFEPKEKWNSALTPE